MDEGTLLGLLAHLGVDDMNYKALALLPLVQVAWSDGEIQPEERAVILGLAKDTWGLSADGMMLLNNWLHYRPSEAYVHRGQGVLVALAGRARGLRLEVDALGDVVSLAQDVARAAGGLFGIGAISRAEGDAIRKIAAALKISKGAELVSVKALGEAFGAPEKRARVTLTLKTATLGSGSQEAVLIPDVEPSMKVAVTREGLVVGSGEGAGLQIAFDPGIDTQHCRFIERDRSYYVLDMSSAEGTWVNEERVAERRLLGGEAIRLGSTGFSFKWLKRISL
jgi:tellurite resistance protein